jgi:hypothetical protein
MGQLYGFARVNGKVVLEGTMTFALGPTTSAASKDVDDLSTVARRAKVD